MKYDFESIIDRKGKALAIDGLSTLKGFSPEKPKDGFDEIPMWVADMNFKTCPTIQEEINKRLNHPTFGYFLPVDEFYDSIISWQFRHNHVKNLNKDNIGYENGILGGLVSTVLAYIKPGDKVLLHSPTYIGFTYALENAGIEIVLSPLVERNGHFEMDYEDMDKKIKENNIKIGIICNPHNPCGRNWTKEELIKACKIYEDNNCIIISDEIWSDLILFDNEHISTQLVSTYAYNNTVALYSTGKTFNLSGIVNGYHIIYNKELKEKVDKQSSINHYNSMNVLSMHAIIGAYDLRSDEWLEELLLVLSNNVEYAYNYIINNFKGIKTFKPEATYMLYIDCKDYCIEFNKTIDELLNKAWDVGVGIQDGRPFHNEYGIRMNLALPFSQLKEAFNRLSKYVFVD